MVTGKKPNDEDATTQVILSEAIEAFMASVPDNPQGGERDWSSVDMAAHLLKYLDTGGYVLLSVEQEMPTMTEEITKIALALIANGADVYTAGAGAMWEALQQYFKKELVPVDEGGLEGYLWKFEDGWAICLACGFRHRSLPRLAERNIRWHRTGLMPDFPPCNISSMGSTTDTEAR